MTVHELITLLQKKAPTDPVRLGIIAEPLQPFLTIGEDRSTHLIIPGKHPPTKADIFMDDGVLITWIWNTYNIDEVENVPKP